MRLVDLYLLTWGSAIGHGVFCYAVGFSLSRYYAKQKKGSLISQLVWVISELLVAVMIASIADFSEKCCLILSGSGLCSGS